MAEAATRTQAGPATKRTGSPPRTGHGPWRAARRGRRVPYVALGGLLVIGCVLSFAYAAARLGDRVPVLAVARPLAAGQVITASDLMEVSAAEDPALRLVPASQAALVTGRTAAVPLVPGTLLTEGMVGDAAFPPAGRVVSSLALKPGQYPQGLPVGARVVVFVSANTAAAGSQPAAPGPGTAGPLTRLSAVVLGVDPAGDGQGGTLVTLLLDASDAERLAGAPIGGVVLMQTASGGE